MTNPLGSSGAGSGRQLLGRRGLLISGGLAALGLAGCTPGSSPLQGSTSSTGPSPAPTPLPGTQQAAAREDDLVRYAAAALSRLRTDLDPTDRHLLARIRDTHRLHAAALRSNDPLALSAAGPSAGAPATSPDAPTPTPSSAVDKIPSQPATALRTLAGMESRLADQHRRRALRPDGPEDRQPLLALLWGSLAAAAQTCAAACSDHLDHGRAVAGDHRLPVVLPDATTAVQDVVGQCDAIIFGYQAATAEFSGGRGDHARAEIGRYRGLRDQLSGRLSDHDQSVPEPHAAYRLPVQPTSPSAAITLIGGMEARMLPYLGGWLATDPGHRDEALRALITTSEQTLVWSGRIVVWPGWPSKDS